MDDDDWPALLFTLLDDCDGSIDGERDVILQYIDAYLEKQREVNP